MIAQDTTLSERSQKILLKLYEYGKEVYKTTLKSVVPNNYSLSRHLEELEKGGYIKIREEKIVRITYYISLTPKGIATAEQIKNIGREERTKNLELPDIFKLILFVSEHGRCKFSELKNEFPGAYSYTEELKASGIIEVTIDNSQFPSETIISLKKKGILVAQKLKEIEEILKRD